MLAELGRQSMAAEVEQLIRAHPRWGKERIAEQLQLSGRHLHRRLAEDGLTFKALRDSVLQSMACQLLGSDLRLSQRSEEHTSELQSRPHLVCRLLLEKKKNSE